MFFIFFAVSLLHGIMLGSYQVEKKLPSTESLITLFSPHRTSSDLPVKLLVSNGKRYQWNPYTTEQKIASTAKKLPSPIQSPHCSDSESEEEN